MIHTIWYVGGKSAGHIIPLVTLARQRPQDAALFITTHRELDKKIINDARLTSAHVPLYVPDIQLKKFWLYPWHAIVWLGAFVRLGVLFFKTRPHKVVSTGGLSAVPVFLVARCFSVPCELFELNAMPGNAVTFLAPLSNKIYHCYESALHSINHKATFYRPYPIRKLETLSVHQARSSLELDPTKKTICFLGGSQGSRFINHVALKVVAQLPAGAIQVVHQAGTADAARLMAWYQEHGIAAFVVDYHKQIERLYRAADLVVCRAGAGTLWELEYLNIPTIIIPLETATTDHQLHNAQALCQQKPQQFILLRQHDAQSTLERIISFLGELTCTNG